MDVADQRQHHKVTLAVVAAAAVAYSVQQTMVIPAIPTFQDEFHSSGTTSAWLLTSFLLSSSVATPILGRLGDMFGKRKVLVWLLLVFAVGSVISALAQSMGVLIAGRAIQGVAGGVFPLCYGIVRDEFPAGEVAGGIGLISAIFGVGAGVGLVASGLIVDHLDVAWTFWASLPVTLGAAAAALLFVPESPTRVPGKVDWPGATILSAGLIMVLLAITEGQDWGWTSVKTLGIAADGLLMLVLFVLYELRVAAPLVDMRMMARRVVSTTNIAAMFIGAGMYGSFILIPELAQLDPADTGFGFGAGVLGGALFLLPCTMFMLLGSSQSGRIGDRVGHRAPLALGAGVAVFGYLAIAFLHDERWEVYVGSAIVGIGIGLAFASQANLILADVPQNQTGIATGMNTIFRTVGGAVGTTVTASVISSSMEGGFPTEGSYSTAFVILAISSASGVIAALALPAAAGGRARSPWRRLMPARS